jgi:sugar phosphate isomerase/epimerase
MIRLCCADYGWPSVTHRTALSIIADLGFAGVDIGVFGDATHVTVPSVVADPRARAADVRRDTDAAGLVVSDVFLTASLDLGRITPTSAVPGDQSELREIFAASVTFAAELGAPGITLLPGVVDEGRTVTEAIAAAAEGLAPLVDMGAAAGLGVSVEPHFGSCIEDPETTAELLERCEGLTITLDPSHFVYAGWPVTSMLPLLGRTRHVQIRPGAEGVMQAKVRDNGFDLPLLVAGLVDIGYDGWLASEYVWMEKWRCDEVDNTGESGRLRVLLAELVAANASGTR